MGRQDEKGRDRKGNVKEIVDRFEQVLSQGGKKIKLTCLPQPKYILVGMARKDGTRYILNQTFPEF
jgi:hypothetical protein